MKTPKLLALGALVVSVAVGAVANDVYVSTDYDPYDSVTITIPSYSVGEGYLSSCPGAAAYIGSSPNYEYIVSNGEVADFDDLGPGTYEVAVWTYSGGSGHAFAEAYVEW